MDRHLSCKRINTKCRYELFCVFSVLKLQQKEEIIDEVTKESDTMVKQNADLLKKVSLCLRVIYYLVNIGKKSQN